MNFWRLNRTSARTVDPTSFAPMNAASVRFRAPRARSSASRVNFGCPFGYTQVKRNFLCRHTLRDHRKNLFLPRRELGHFHPRVNRRRKLGCVTISIGDPPWNVYSPRQQICDRPEEFFVRLKLIHEAMKTGGKTVQYVALVFEADMTAKRVVGLSSCASFSRSSKWWLRDPESIRTKSAYWLCANDSRSEAFHNVGTLNSRLNQFPDTTPVNAVLVDHRGSQTRLQSFKYTAPALERPRPRK